MNEEPEMLNITANNKDSRILLRQNTIDHVILKATDSDFMSQQKDLMVFSPDERRRIANKVLDNSHLKFLYLFGEYLLEDHLEYFKGENIDNYEINFHLHRLSRLINSKKVKLQNKQIIIIN